MTQKIESCCSNSKGHSPDVDPVCGMRIDKARPHRHLVSDSGDFYFCSNNCLRIFKRTRDHSTSDATIGDGKNLAVPMGMLGGTGLVVLFSIAIAIIMANSSIDFAVAEIQRLWYWVVLLAIGFGLQLGLFVHIRHTVQQRLTAAKAELAASGAVSTGSMVACCSHGLVTLLPFLGVSAAATFLARYQLSFLLLGLFSNLLGITFMIGLAQKNNVVFSNALLKYIAGLNMKALRIFLVVTGLIALGVSFASS
ncbi:MAG: hypothetical protein ACN4GW_21365 [Desulforhopalus sp.]